MEAPKGKPEHSLDEWLNLSRSLLENLGVEVFPHFANPMEGTPTSEVLRRPERPEPHRLFQTLIPTVLKAS